ncbi:sensor histidine kinase [Paludisphaera soli]|uniref:sensor histidine kinase n=1 Tax=Paludisphaera soli TaxID=2712865 RepID=UPI0013EE27E2|nr:ATP-binding protein [Paludisphaera soli]
MVDDLTQALLLGRGDQRISRDPLNLCDVVVAAVNAIRPLVDGRGHALEVVLQREPMTVNGDPIRLRQVFVNLLADAAWFTDKGGRITIDARREGAEITVAVRDTGRGVAPEMVPLLFETYDRKTRSSDPGWGRMGIGLSVASGLAALHGGSVTAASDGPEAGSEFTVRLPFVESPQA